MLTEEDVIETCSFRDEEDDCTYHYTVDYAVKPTDVNEVQVLKKKGEQSCVQLTCASNAY